MPPPRSPLTAQDRAIPVCHHGRPDKQARPRNVGGALTLTGDSLFEEDAVMQQNRSHRSRRRRPIVVGVDGTSRSKVALRWALEQAALTGTSVEAIIVWTRGAVLYYGYECAPVAPDDDGLAAAAEAVLMDTLVEILSEHGGRVPIKARVIQGRPGEELLIAARSAEMLVLGSPKHGNMAGILLGSVSHDCIHNAPCPVVVAPAGPSTAAPSSRMVVRDAAWERDLS
jgi:nucleotide-binding universal stress UspA family protein